MLAPLFSESLRHGSTFLTYRIMGWKRPLRSSSPAIHSTPLCLLNHTPKCHIYTFFRHLQGWRLNHVPRKTIPMSDHSFSKDIFPHIQSKPPLMQLEAIASCPVSRYLGEETNTCLTTTSFQVVVESDKFPLCLLFCRLNSPSSCSR